MSPSGCFCFVVKLSDSRHLTICWCFNFQYFLKKINLTWPCLKMPKVACPSCWLALVSLMRLSECWMRLVSTGGSISPRTARPQASQAVGSKSESPSVSCRPGSLSRETSAGLDPPSRIHDWTFELLTLTAARRHSNTWQVTACYIQSVVFQFVFLCFFNNAASWPTDQSAACSRSVSRQRYRGLKDEPTSQNLIRFFS